MARRAFTLVELMVVVAIIGILVGIIVPSARAIQRESRNTGCMANLRQDFAAIDSYRLQRNGQLPMCEFLPVVTENGIDGGLPKLLGGFIPAESPAWLCPADENEESTATGTSYVYLPGLLRYSPVVQADVVTLLMSFDASSMTMDQLNAVRLDAEARAMTAFYETEGAKYPLLIDSEDRHQRVGSERNGVFTDGSARIAEIDPPDEPPPGAMP